MPQRWKVLVLTWLSIILPLQGWATVRPNLYYIPPSPWLDNHGLVFTLPPGWKLVKATTTGNTPISLPISLTGKISGYPYWDTRGILLTVNKANASSNSRLFLSITSSWYLRNGLNWEDFRRHPFSTHSGLKGWWITDGHYSTKQSILFSGIYFSCLLNLDVPPKQGQSVLFDHPYYPVILLGVPEPVKGLNAILRPPTLQELALLKFVGSSLREEAKPSPPPTWLSKPPIPDTEGTSYYTPPVGYWLGRQIRLTLPKGWAVVKDTGGYAEAGGPEGAQSGWFKSVPLLLVQPNQPHVKKEEKLQISLWVSNASYLANEGRQVGNMWIYPFHPVGGLPGLVDYADDVSAFFYVETGRFDITDNPSFLTVGCQLPQSPKLAAALRPIALALLSSVTVIPPSKQTTKPNLPFDPAFLYDITFDQPFHPNPLLYAANGRLYASATFHRSQNPGFLFSLSPNGTGFRVLHSFTPLQPDFSNQDGAFPFAPLAQDAHQHLFGTTSTGGPACDGTLFTLQTDGSHFHLLHAFSGPDGALPYAGVLPTQDGWLYGVTEEGGPYGKGVVYRIREDGTGFQVLHSFGGREGAYPLLVELVEGEGGWLYGVTSGGGVYGNGVVFGVKADGSGYRVLHEFGAEDGLGRNGDGSHPYCGLVLGLGGWLYRVTYGGGVYGAGVVFGVKADGSGYRVLHALKGGVEGSHVVGRLLLLGDKLYGVCSEGGSLGGGCVFVLGVGGEGYRVLHSFGVDGEGWTGLGGLVMLDGGWLYGVTEGGGIGGQGVMYRLRADGSGFGAVYDLGKRLKPVPSR